MKIALAVAAFGALGALSRYGMIAWLRAWVGEVGPWPVAVVNVVGCFGFGLAYGLLQERLAQPVAIAVLAGFFGAFTTMSAFAFDGFELLQQRRILLLLANVALQNVLGVLALWGGVQLTARG